MKWAQWYEVEEVGCPASVLAGYGELAQEAANHLWLDFHLVDGLAVSTPTTLPTISRRMITSQEGVFATSGFSVGASFVALRRLSSECGSLRRPGISRRCRRWT